MNTFGPTMEPVTALLPGVRRFVAPNPSMMTGPGTNTYLFGEGDIAVLDPGPVIDTHLEHIRRDAGGTIRWVVVTHTHPDHSPAASVLAKMTGAELLGRPAPTGEHQDYTFVPDRILEDGDALVTDEFVLEAVHTPGHASNHLCYLHAESNWLFTGDHVIDGSTVVINPPDGNMKQYIESLRRVLELGVDAIVPGHGEVVTDPERLVNWIIDHRLEREDKVLAALQANPGLAPRNLVPHVYQDVPEHLYGLAERSLLAHLIKLEEEGRAVNSDDLWSPLD
ncbi:MAG: MBL fold metallo-hydrolase [Woeseiaceae bacterium]|nr:MBL fold metallo-hydrolase [Woeseiaceae bacterium]